MYHWKFVQTYRYIHSLCQLVISNLKIIVQLLSKTNKPCICTVTAEGKHFGKIYESCRYHV